MPSISSAGCAVGTLETQAVSKALFDTLSHVTNRSLKEKQTKKLHTTEMKTKKQKIIIYLWQVCVAG